MRTLQAGPGSGAETDKAWKVTEISYKEIRKSEEINTYIEQGDAVLGELGYTEHSRKHAARTAETAGKILKELGYEKKNSGAGKNRRVHA